MEEMLKEKLKSTFKEIDVIEAKTKKLPPTKQNLYRETLIRLDERYKTYIDVLKILEGNK